MRWRVMHKNGSGKELTKLPKSTQKVFDDGTVQIFQSKTEHKPTQAFEVHLDGVVSNLLVFRSVYFPAHLQVNAVIDMAALAAPAFAVVDGMFPRRRHTNNPLVHSVLRDLGQSAEREVVLGDLDDNGAGGSDVEGHSDDDDDTPRAALTANDDDNDEDDSATEFSDSDDVSAMVHDLDGDEDVDSEFLDAEC